MTSTAGRTESGIPSARRAQTRERLIAAAVSVIAERGIIGASVEEISDRAGFTRGAFYSNFSDKDDLVLAILHHYAELDLQAVHETSQTLAGRLAQRRDQGAPVGTGDHSDTDDDSRDADAWSTVNRPGTLINIALTRLFGDAAHDRDAILARNEMNLYAIRRPELREGYRQYLDQLYDRVADFVGPALEVIGVEFTVDFHIAIPLLHACSSQIEMAALLSDTPADTAGMETLIKAITRPVGQDREPGCAAPRVETQKVATREAVESDRETDVRHARPGGR